MFGRKNKEQSPNRLQEILTLLMTEQSLLIKQGRFEEANKVAEKIKKYSNKINKTYMSNDRNFDALNNTFLRVNNSFLNEAYDNGQNRHKKSM